MRPLHITISQGTQHVRRLTSFSLSFFLFVAVAYGADRPAKPRDDAPPTPEALMAMDTATEPVIPKRELNFVMSDDPVTLTLTADDPKLLEQRYQASFMMRIPGNIPPSNQWRASLDGNSLYQAPVRDEAGRRARDNFGFFISGLHLSAAYPDYSRLLGSIPKDHQPPQGLIDALNQGRPYLHLPATNGSVPGKYQRLRGSIIAPTPEQAKELVQALVELYDYGLSYPVQAEFLRQKQVDAEVVANAREAIAKFKAVSDDYTKKLESLSAYGDIGNEVLANCRSQQRMLDVDLAGVKARLAACNKLLAEAHERAAHLPARRRPEC